MFLRRLLAGLKRKQASFDSFELADFDPLFLYLYEWEPPSQAEAKYEYPSLMYAMFQQEDMYFAMKYASEHIIPIIASRRFSDLTEDDIIHWIKSIHGHAARTLMYDHPGEVAAGEYSTETVYVFKCGLSFGREFFDHFTHPPALQKLFDQYNLHHLYPNIEALITHLAQETKIKLPSSFDIKTEHPTKTFFEKVSLGFEQGLVTAEEMAAVNQVVQIKRTEKTQENMFEFAQALLERLKKCDGSRHSVVRVAAFVFQGLTKRHHFGNGNGRVGIVLLESILKGFLGRTVVMRDMFDTENQFDDVTSQMDADISILERYIDKRLDEAEHVHPALLEMARLVLQSKKYLLDLFYDILKLNNPLILNAAIRDAHTKGSQFFTRLILPFLLGHFAECHDWKINQQKGIKIWRVGLSSSDASILLGRLNTLIGDLFSNPSEKKPTVRIAFQKVTNAPVVMIEDEQNSLCEKLVTHANTNFRYHQPSSPKPSVG